MQGFNQQKDKGNALFKEKKFNEALQVFMKAIQQIQKIQSKQYLVPTTQLSKLYVILLINSAFACINIKSQDDYLKAIQFCNKAVSIDQKNVKALFRRGLAKKQYAQQQQKAKGPSQGLLQYYTSAKQDFQKVNVIQRSNELALQKFNETVKDIYRVTVALNQKVDFTNTTNNKEQSQSTVIKVKQNLNNPYQNESIVKKKGINMEKIMEQYKVNEVSEIAKKKIYQHYLSGQLPGTRAELQKAIRQIKKSEQNFLLFVYRFTNDYMSKIQPTFDMLSELVNIILKNGTGDSAKNSLLVLKSCKSFNLFWKSLISKEKAEFKAKWTQLGLNEQLLN